MNMMSLKHCGWDTKDPSPEHLPRSTYHIRAFECSNTNSSVIVLNAEPVHGHPVIDLQCARQYGVHDRSLARLLDLLVIADSTTPCTPSSCACLPIWGVDVYTRKRDNAHEWYMLERQVAFRELARVPLQQRALYEVVPPDTPLNFFMDLEFARPETCTDDTWNTLFHVLSGISLPLIHDRVCAAMLSRFRLTDKPSAFVSMALHPHTTLQQGDEALHVTSTVKDKMVFRDFPTQKWSAHLVWKHPHAMLPNMVAARVLAQELVDTLSTQVNPASFAMLGEVDLEKLSDIVDTSVYTHNRRFRTVGAVKIGQDRVQTPVSVPEITDGCRIFSLCHSIDAQMWMKHLLLTPLSTCKEIPGRLTDPRLEAGTFSPLSVVYYTAFLSLSPCPDCSVSMSAVLIFASYLPQSKIRPR